MPLLALCALLVVGIPLLAYGPTPGREPGAAHAEEARAALRQTPEPLQTAMRVRVAVAREGNIRQTMPAAGLVSAFRRATVAAEVAGRVVDRSVEPGDGAEAGQPLVRLDETRLALLEAETQAALLAAQVDLREAERNLERGERLAAENAISESRHDALRFAVERASRAVQLADVALTRSRRNRADATVRAPFAGSVESVTVNVGDRVAPGTPIAVVVDLSKARVRAGVTGAEAARLGPGSPARIVFGDLGGQIVDAEVHSVGYVADAATGTYPVEIWVDNVTGSLREGMVADVRFPSGGGMRKIVVPRSALIRHEGQSAVFVVERTPQGPRVGVRSVRTGAQGSERVEVIAGLQDGEEVVIDGLFALRDGARVAVDRPSLPAKAWTD